MSRFQFESEAEVQQLKNAVKSSGLQIQQLKNYVTDLESKIIQSMDSEHAIYLIGGFDGKSWLSSLDSFSPSMDFLVPRKSMSTVRSYASAAALDGNLYVFGGRGGSLWFNTGTKGFLFFTRYC